MIIFEPEGKKTLILVILVACSIGIIAWQWIASKPFANVNSSNNLIAEIQNSSIDSFINIKTSVKSSTKDVDKISEETDKQLKQAKLIDEAKKYLYNKEECLTKKGEWAIWGNDINETCNLFTTDAGKDCQDSSECEGYCVADLPEIVLKDLPVKTAGKCTTRTVRQGCYSLVEEGLVNGVTCN